MGFEPIACYQFRHNRFSDLEGIPTHISQFRKLLHYAIMILSLVRLVGLEPTRLSAPDPRSGVSTNSTIDAFFEPQEGFEPTFSVSNYP